MKLLWLAVYLAAACALGHWLRNSGGGRNA